MTLRFVVRYQVPFSTTENKCFLFYFILQYYKQCKENIDKTVYYGLEDAFCSKLMSNAVYRLVFWHTLLSTFYSNHIHK